MKLTRVVKAILSIIISLAYTSPLAFADTNRGIGSYIAADAVLELIEYKERAKDNGLESDATPQEIVVGIDGLKRWDHIFCGVRATIPVLLISGQEKIDSYGSLYQRNDLEYRWLRIDGYVGYPFKPGGSPYLGVRWSDMQQVRNNFFISGNRATLYAEEEIKSWNMLLGIRGIGNITPSLKWNYWLEYFLPLNVQVTNSLIAGFEATDRAGYALELRGRIDYLYNDSKSIGVILYGGWAHWSGSDWKQIGSVSVKWPENDSFYLGIGVNATYGK